jgi:hypothetical protein
MGMFDWFTWLFDRNWQSLDRDWPTSDHWRGPDQNPATGVPMAGGVFEVLGNPWGTDLGAQQMDALRDAAHHRRQFDDPYSHHTSGSLMFNDWHDWHRDDWNRHY